MSHHFKLSPNEQAALIQQERRERRKIRLVQVREQEREFARQVRNNVRRKTEEERKLLDEHIKEHLAVQHSEQLRQMEETLIARRRQYGQAHRDAQCIEQEEQKLQELRLLLSSQQRTIAKKRQAMAMQELTENQLKEKTAKENVILARNHALATERERAKSVASSKKYSPSALLVMELEANPSHLGTRRVQGVEAFASTYFHLPDNLVHREITPTPYELDATQAAQQAALEEQEHQRQQIVQKDEQQVKAHMRHKHALAQVKLEQEKVTLLKDLSLLAREDRTHRQQVLQHIPANLFQPVQQRLQEQEVQQHELEHAFEKLLTRQPSTCQTTDNELPTWSEPPDNTTTTSISNRDDSVSTPPPQREAMELTIETVTPSIAPSQSAEQSREETDKRNAVEGESSVSISSIADSKGGNSSQSDNISRLVGMIRNQRQARQDKAATGHQSTATDSSSLSITSNKIEGGGSLSISTLSNSQGPPADIDQQCTLPTTTTTVNTTSSVPSAELTIETIENSSDDEDEKKENRLLPVAQPPLTSYYQPAAVYYYPTLYYPQMPTVPIHPSVTAPVQTVITNGFPDNTTKGLAICSTSSNTSTAEHASESTKSSPAIMHSTTTPFVPVITPLASPHLSAPHLSSPSPVAPRLSSPSPVAPHLSSPSPVAPRLSSPVAPHLSSPSPVAPRLPSPVAPNLSSPSPVTPRLSSPVAPNLSSPVAPRSPSPVAPHLYSPVASRLSSPSSPVARSVLTPPTITEEEPICQNDQQRSEFIQSLLTSLQEAPENSLMTSNLETSTALSESNSSTSPSKSPRLDSTPLSVATSPHHLVQTNALPPVGTEHQTKSYSATSLSLQEAFRLKKQNFIEQSQARVKALEEKAKEREADTLKKATTKSTRLVTFCSPVPQRDRDSSITMKHTPPSIHKLQRDTTEPLLLPQTQKGPPERLFSSKPGKISTKEMHTRSLRLYSRLPEVQERRKASQRQKEYAENREKAKLYYQELRKKSTKKRTN